MSVKNYRKKPVALTIVAEGCEISNHIIEENGIIKVIQFTGYNINEVELFTDNEITIHPFNVYTIKTSYGDIAFSIGDYIIKGENGEPYPCAKYIFETIYQEIKSNERNN